MVKVKPYSDARSKVLTRNPFKHLTNELNDLLLPEESLRNEVQKIFEVAEVKVSFPALQL